jgi:toxin ParE1/3/4
MSRTMLIRPEAEADLAEAHAWYEKQRPGLGISFMDEVRGALARIAAGPLRYQIVYRYVRRIAVRRFPYAIYYVYRDDVIVVLAVVHQRRDPRVWKKRVNE